MFESFWVLVLAVSIAGLVRGYAGFGFAAIAVVGLNFTLAPQLSIPVVLALDVLCSAGLWRQARQQADIATFKLLTTGAVLGIPFGLLLLLLIDAQLLKLIICIIILVLAIALLFDAKPRNADKLRVKLGFGMASGMGTAGASVGGPMIVCYMLASPLTASAQRATMILFFIVSEGVSISVQLASGLASYEFFIYTISLLLPTLLAVRAGQWLFNKNPPKSLKHFALPIMALAAILGISASVQAIF
ncbi:sulfite exporter TauE/SafE family protein [Reinekea thalattae]|uniref:Probable membrane transporter protein n=1 Tax=Reinekea thalattae TaxID=2593301 RepID=A0A5C8Z563_9GAMM|nr:sulfite exporter TauE/SafE family protein [Reinekea thalattae]TXR52046.1 sulfite exporter TauE/SafE family protein [Reinekea thalattae]